jgi:hypothetical protein
VGTQNTASGYYALSTNTAGNYNTAAGSFALMGNTGSNNTASGFSTLSANTIGSANTATGYLTMLGNIGGQNNTALGALTFQNNVGGGNNIAIGFETGNGAPPANNDSIYIGASGSGSDLSGTIQIGTAATETTGTIQIGSAQAGGTFIAGITGVPVTGAAVYVNAKGQIGIQASSGRFKEQITDMGDTSSKLLQLRPVNFFYKPQYDDGMHELQYGLIAEDVAKVYPEMVVYDKHGEILSVKYQLLAPMLLNELQKQAAQNLQQAQDIRSLEDRLAAVEAGIATGSPSGPQPVR